MSPRSLSPARPFLLAAFLLLVGAAPALAATATRVGPLNPSTADTELHSFVTVGDSTLFTAAPGFSAPALWESGASGLTEVAGAPAEAQPRVVSGSTLYVSARDDEHGTELWKRRDGVWSLVVDLTVGPGDTALNWMAPGPDGSLYFTASADGGNYYLYKTDGTAGGTTRINDANGPVDGVSELTAFAGRVLFARSEYTHGSEVWTSDGTVGGTHLVKDVNPVLGDGIGGGGAGGGSNPHFLTPAGGSVYFVANPETGSGYGLWKTDGTEAGTVPVDTTGATGAPNGLSAAGDLLYFRQDDEVLRRTDGTTTETVRDGAGDAVTTYDVAQAGTTTYFARQTSAAGDELWKTGGMGSVASLVADIAPGAASSSPSGFKAVGSTMFFAADDGTHGNELWRSDGSAPGTTLVADLAAGRANAYPQTVAVRGTTLLFSANDRLHGRELWTTDGTTAGTALTRDLSPDPVGDAIGTPAALGASAYFAGNDGSFDSPDFMNGPLALYRATGDGAPQAVRDAGGNLVYTPQELTAAGGRLFFGAFDQTHGQELWSTDGTPAGTGLLADIRAGESGSEPHELVAARTRVFFSAEDDDHGAELWTSDGTTAGTKLVADVRPGEDSSSPERITAVGGRVYFLAGNADDDEELWTSDGTSAGTVPVRSGGSIVLNANGLTAVGTQLLVRQGDALLRVDAATPAVASTVTTLVDPPSTPIVAAGGVGYFGIGAQLWRTDGTAGGTALVRDTGGADPVDAIAAVGTKVFFSAANASGDTELWRSDGTTAGTAEVVDLLTGGSSSPHDLFAAGDLLFFLASDGTSDQLMTSDGTAAGTGAVPGAGPVGGWAGAAAAGSRLFIALTAPDAGPFGSAALWRVGLPEPPAGPGDPPDDHTPGGGGVPGDGGGTPGGGGTGTGGGGTTPTVTTPTVTTPKPPPGTTPITPRLTLGRVTTNRRKGTATFTLTATVPGTVRVSAAGVRTVSAKLRGKRVTVSIRPNAKLAKTLRKRHRATVTLTLTYQPTGQKKVVVKRKVTLVRRG